MLVLVQVIQVVIVEQTVCTARVSVSATAAGKGGGGFFSAGIGDSALTTRVDRDVVSHVVYLVVDDKPAIIRTIVVGDFCS